LSFRPIEDSLYCCTVVPVPVAVTKVAMRTTTTLATAAPGRTALRAHAVSPKQRLEGHSAVGRGARLVPNNRRERCCSARAELTRQSSSAASVDGLGKECPPQGCLTDLSVEDIMISPCTALKAGDSYLDALSLMVNNGFSGLPVVDDDNKVVGVVSGYDILALDCTPGRMKGDNELFPSVDMDINFSSKEEMWAQFSQRKSVIAKETGRTIGEVMRTAATIYRAVSINDAADMMVHNKIHRIPVVGEDDTLVGIITRSDILKATLQDFR